jgi:hypothetical protein
VAAATTAGGVVVDVVVATGAGLKTASSVRLPVPAYNIITVGQMG